MQKLDDKSTEIQTADTNKVKKVVEAPVIKEIQIAEEKVSAPEK